MLPVGTAGRKTSTIVLLYCEHDVQRLLLEDEQEERTQYNSAVGRAALKTEQKLLLPTRGLLCSTSTNNTTSMLTMICVHAHHDPHQEPVEFNPSLGLRA